MTLYCFDMEQLQIKQCKKQQNRHKLFLFILKQTKSEHGKHNFLKKYAIPNKLQKKYFQINLG